MTRENEDAVEEHTMSYDRWKRALKDGRILGQVCQDCGAVTASYKIVCAHCGSRDIETTSLPTTGEVFTETTIYTPPSQFDGTYQVAIISLGEARVMAHIEGEVEIGDQVELQGTISLEDDVGPVFG